MTLSILMMRMAIKVAFCDRRKGMKPWGPRFRKSDHKAPRGGGGAAVWGSWAPGAGTPADLRGERQRETLSQGTAPERATPLLPE